MTCTAVQQTASTACADRSDELPVAAPALHFS
jgi:hypothetical protein